MFRKSMILRSGGGSGVFSQVGNVIRAIIPASVITLYNNIWLAADNFAGAGVINMFRVNVSDEIECGATIITGATEAAADSGAIVAMDMPVSATPAAGTEMSYSYRVDGDTIMKIYAEADSAGGIQNPSMVVDSQINMKEMTTPTAVPNYGAVYVKNDNHLYFQDGAGVEHLVV